MPVDQLRLNADQEERLTQWLTANLQTIQERRQRRVTRWRDYRQQYEGSVQKQKNFPWRNASNVHVPITAIIVDAIHANMMNRIFGHERVWDIKALHPKEIVGMDTRSAQPITWVELAKAVQGFLNFEASQQGTMDVYNVVEEAILECIKLGTSVVYNPWVTEIQEGASLDHATGLILRGKKDLIFDGIRPKMVPLEDFLILPHYAEVTGLDASPLIGHRYWLRKGQIQNRAAAGWFRSKAAVDAVLEAPGAESGDDEELKDHQSTLEGENDTIQDLRKEDYQLQDCWIKFPLLSNEREVNLFVTYHLRSGTILRIHPWIYRTPPYAAFRYVRREGRFYGIGVPEMLETIQRGVNTSFNQSVDNATIANMRCFKIKRNSQAARFSGDIFPGKKFFVDQMEDIDSMQLGEVYPSIFQVGLLLRDFAERRTGVSDFNLGRESETLGRSSTATTTMALLQESSRRFDLYAKDIRRAIGELGIQSIELIQQHKPVEKFYTVMGEDGQLVDRALTLPQEVSLREHLLVTSTSSASSSNKEVGRQNSLQAFQLLTQYAQGMFQLAQVMIAPDMPEPMKKLAYDMSQTGERLMQRILEGFDMPDIALLLPQLEGLINATQQGATQGANQGGGVGGPNGTPVDAQAGVPGPGAVGPGNPGGFGS